MCLFNLLNCLQLPKMDFLFSMGDCDSGCGSKVNSTENGNLTQRRVAKLQMGRRLVAGPTCQTRCFITFLVFCFWFIVKMPLAKTQITFSRMISNSKKTTTKTKNKKSFDACILLANIYMFAFIVYCCFLKFFFIFSFFVYFALLFRWCVIYLASARAEEFVELHA